MSETPRTTEADQSEAQIIADRLEQILKIERHAVDTVVVGVYVSAGTLERAIKCLRAVRRQEGAPTRAE